MKLPTTCHGTGCGESLLQWYTQHAEFSREVTGNMQVEWFASETTHNNAICQQWFASQFGTTHTTTHCDDVKAEPRPTDSEVPHTWWTSVEPVATRTVTADTTTWDTTTTHNSFLFF